MWTTFLFSWVILCDTLGLSHLRKVSTHVSLRRVRRLTSAETFRHLYHFVSLIKRWILSHDLVDCWTTLEFISSHVINTGQTFAEHNECRKTRVTFADLSLLRQIFPNINHKLMKSILFLLIILSTNALEQKKVVPDFRHEKNDYFDREGKYTYFPPELTNFFTCNNSKNRHMKYNISNVTPGTMRYGD